MLLLLALWQIRRALICSIFLAGAIFFVGVTTAQLQASFFPRDHVAFLTTPTERLVELELKIDEQPIISSDVSEYRRVPPKQVVSADVTGVAFPSGWSSASGRIVVSIEPPDDNLAAGQTIRAWGLLSRPDPTANPGQTDYAARDRDQRILAYFRIRRASTIQVIRDDGVPLIVRWREKSRQLLADGFPVAKQLDAAFLRLLLLGDSSRIVAQVRDQFDMTGTAYLLSISGLHIAILGGAVLLVLRILRVRPGRAIAVSMLVVALYAAVALPSQSGIRSLVMCTAGAAGLLAGRPARGFQILAISVLGILFFNPIDLYSAGFQIGAAAVLGILLFAPPLGAFLYHPFGEPDFPPVHPVQRGPFATLVMATLRRAGVVILISGVIWLTILPLAAVYFHQLSLWAVPGGCALLPLSVVTILDGAAKVGLSFVLPHFSPLWAGYAAIPSEWLRHSVRFLAGLPAAAIPSPPPSPLAIAAYYALLITPLFPWRPRLVRWSARCAPVAAAILILLPPISSIAASAHSTNAPVTENAKPRDEGMQVTVLSVGSGQTALVRIAGGETFLIDCGSQTIPDVYARAIHPFLRQEMVSRIDRIILSHVDYARICAAAQAIEGFQILSVDLAPEFQIRSQASYPAQELLRYLQLRGPAPATLQRGDRLNLGGGASLSVLWPPPNCSMNSANSGLVLRLNYAGRSILFPSDIGEPAELALLNDPQSLRCDVLVAPHNGSAERSTAAFLHSAEAKFIICSSDRTLTQKQVQFDEVAKDGPVYRTGTCGAIEVKFGEAGNISIAAYDGLKAEHAAAASIAENRP